MGHSTADKAFIESWPGQPPCPQLQLQRSSKAACSTSQPLRLWSPEALSTPGLFYGPSPFVYGIPSSWNAAFFSPPPSSPASLLQPASIYSLSTSVTKPSHSFISSILDSNLIRARSRTLLKIHASNKYILIASHVPFNTTCWESFYFFILFPYVFIGLNSNSCIYKHLTFFHFFCIKENNLPINTCQIFQFSIVNTLAVTLWLAN